MSAKRFCLQCDDGTELVHGARDKVITLETKSVVVTKIKGHHCPICGESEFDIGEGKRYSAALSALRKEVNNDSVSTLRNLRKKLGLKQTEASQLLGERAQAFAEYERGKTRPPHSTVLLLKLLGKHPELMAEIRL